jgi:uncharacterized repeat protein (TIGR01451 family)
VNTVSVTTDETVAPLTSQATVRMRRPTPGTIQYFQFAPGAPGSRGVPVVPGTYRTGANETDAFAPLQPAWPTGHTAPIDLSRSVPLVEMRQLHQGDPAFVIVTDLDQNFDPLVRETVEIDIEVSLSGDLEHIVLTEIAANSGSFSGYIPTQRGEAGTHWNGVLEVVERSTAIAKYVDRYDLQEAVADAVLVDPFGIFFDSQTGTPVDGVQVTILDLATGRPAEVFGDDGLSSYPATLVTGGDTSDSSGRTYDFRPGEYRFPFLRPGNYRFELRPPSGYVAPSTVPEARLQTLPNGPFAIVEPGSRGGAFAIVAGPALRIDVPIDPVIVALAVSKTADKTVVGVGDFLSYEIAVRNMNAVAPAREVKAVDRLPIGLRYYRGSTRVDGQRASDPSFGADGRTLTFDLGTIAPGSERKIRFVVQVVPGAPVGRDAVNVASATSLGGGTSTLGRAVVRVQEDTLATRSVIMGRVTTGKCSPDVGVGTSGIAGVRVFLEDGTFVVSDRQGLFHFDGVRAGAHVVQLDLDSLPPGFTAGPCSKNTRFAGRAHSQFVDVQGGAMWRADFHVRGPATRRADPTAPPLVEPPGATATPASDAAPATTPVTVATPTVARGELQLELGSTLTGDRIAYVAELAGAGVKVSPVDLSVVLPTGVDYQPGTSQLDGVALPDPTVVGTTLTYPLGEQPPYWKRRLTFSAVVTAAAPDGEQGTRAMLGGTDPSGARAGTPIAVTVIRVQNGPAVAPGALVIRPHFPTLSAELSAEDRKQLDAIAEQIRLLDPEQMVITGHTDNVAIAPKSRVFFPDNEALSLARARSVGQYLMDNLGFAENRLVLRGKGPSQPMARNDSEAGRALNRRVEVTFRGVREAAKGPRHQQVQERSGVVKVEISGLPEAGAAPAPTPAPAPATQAAPTKPAAAKGPADGLIGIADGDLLV